MTTWFTADTHFGQERTLELSKRPFSSVDEMDDEIIQRWNSVVKPDDVVYHLGDFGIPADDEGTPATLNLNGSTIYLVPGNYDSAAVLETLKEDSRVRIIPPRSILPLKEMRAQFCLVHEPSEAVQLDAFYLFGHIHKLQMVKRNGFNVGTDCHHFTPIDLDTVLFYHNAIMCHYDHNVFMSVLGEVE